MFATGAAATWRKSSYSAGANNCVELAGSLDRVRDSKNPDGPVLIADLGAFLAAIKAGRLDG
ncbi:MAG TPA: DUF397 domain-containing protein [Pseudonocardiaceae bacterium]|nr:DUF397 domain-containing protein [Pseudonocardiaceae bacterium]